VARLVLDKFGDLTDNFSSPHARRKVLAGIVMTTGTDVKDAKVISISTGTKCINVTKTIRNGPSFRSPSGEGSS